MKDPILKVYPGIQTDDVKTTEFGTYLESAYQSKKGKTLRMMTLDELQADWCITSGCVLSNKLNMDAHALAWGHYSRVEVDLTQADRHAERHRAAAMMYGVMEEELLKLQVEFQWRMENPGYDPEDPFADIDPGPLPSENEKWHAPNIPPGGNTGL